MVDKDDGKKLNEAYRHIRLKSDEYLGWVEPNGTTYECGPNIDYYAGRVNLDDGKIFETRLGPEKYLGRVDGLSGKIYLNHASSEEEIGEIHKNGHCYLLGSKSRQVYIGKVNKMSSYLHAGAAYLLLIYPRFEIVKELSRKSSIEVLKNAGVEGISGEG